MKRLFRLLLVLSLFLFHPAAFAQERKWDDALDRYERICAQCIDLRTRAQQGERIPSGSVTELLSQLKALRGTLQEAQGKMSRSQRLRYESIRLRYAELFPETAGASDAARTPSMDPAVPSVPREITARAEIMPGYVPEADVSRLMSALEGCISDPAPPFTWRMLAFTGIPDWNVGLMAVCGKGRWGGYLKPSATLHFTRPALSCRSDGTMSSGYIWTTGKERTTRYACTAGATYRPIRWLNVYAGAGYGSRSVLWEDASHRWAQVEDFRVRGLAWDAGVILTPPFRRFSVASLPALSLMAGVSGIGFISVSLEIGVGLSF